MKDKIKLFWRMVKFNWVFFLNRYFRKTKPQGVCLRCIKAGLMVRDLHWTNYRLFRSWAAPLCYSCWRGLSPEERLPYYQEAFKMWEKMGYAKKWGPWESIEKSVLKGK